MTRPALTAQRDLLLVVLDTLVPADAGFPGAGAVAVDHVLAAAAASRDMDRLLDDGLRAVVQATRAAGAASLASLSVDDREAVLRRVEQSHAAGRGDRARDRVDHGLVASFRKVRDALDEAARHGWPAFR